MTERSLVGVPFYEQEGQECLDVVVQNIDQCLSKLAIDASIIININGPNTASGIPHKLKVENSLINSSVELVSSSQLSQARAMDEIIHEASRRKIDRIFLTDADIFRFTDSMKKMWDYDNSKLVVGARYRPYPIEIVEAQFGLLSEDEKLLYQIFDGDQLPQVRNTLKKRGIDRKEWVKSSLMLVDVNSSIGIYDSQNQATDSVMNRSICDEDIGIATDAFFMHMGRTDMTDHIKARLRHFRAAESLGQLQAFLHKEINLPPKDVMDDIAKEIRHSYIKGDFYAMLYLSRCAVRQTVNEICMKMAMGTWTKKDLPEVNKVSLMGVRNYDDALKSVPRFFENVDWESIKNYAVNAPATTQDNNRRPFDMTHHLADYNLAKIAIATFMIDEPLGYMR